MPPVPTPEDMMRMGNPSPPRRKPAAFGGKGGADAMAGMPPPGPGMPLPSMTKPGQGMDAMTAMLGGIGLPPTERAVPMGPGGLPIGANPNPKLDQSGAPLPPATGGSDILGLLTGQAAPGDVYSQPPGAANTLLAGIGPQDPQLGLENLLQMLALIRLGAAGNPQAAETPPDLGSMMGALRGLA